MVFPLPLFLLLLLLLVVVVLLFADKEEESVVFLTTFLVVAFEFLPVLDKEKEEEESADFDDKENIFVFFTGRSAGYPRRRRRRTTTMMMLASRLTCAPVMRSKKCGSLSSLDSKSTKRKKSKKNVKNFTSTIKNVKTQNKKRHKTHRRRRRRRKKKKTKKMMTTTSSVPSSSSSSSSSSLSSFSLPSRRYRRHHHRHRHCYHRFRKKTLEQQQQQQQTATAFLPLDEEDLLRRRRRRRRSESVVASSSSSSSTSSSSSSKDDNNEYNKYVGVIQSDWLDSSQELNLFGPNVERERGTTRPKMRRSESFFTTAEQETIDFSSITDELKRTREFVEPEMKRGFANNIFESATEMEEMMEDDETRVNNAEKERFFRRRRQRRDKDRSISNDSSVPFVLRQVIKAFSYVTNAIVSLLESALPYRVPLTAIRWSVYAVCALLATSLTQKFLVLLACTGGVLLLFGALNAGLNGEDLHENRDRYGSSNRRTRRRSATNTKGRDFDANRKTYARGSKFRTRSNPRWGRGERNSGHRNAHPTMDDDLMDLEIPFTEFVSENLNRAAQFSGDLLGFSFDEDEGRYSQARKPRTKTMKADTNSREIEIDDGNGECIEVTLEKQTEDSSSFTIGYREWLEESGTTNNIADIKDSTTPINKEDLNATDETPATWTTRNDIDSNGEEFVFESYDDDGDDDDDEVEYDDEDENFIEDEDDLIEPVFRRLRENGSQSFSWFKEFVTGRFYGAFQEDRVEVILPREENVEHHEVEEEKPRRGHGRGGGVTR